MPDTFEIHPSLGIARLGSSDDFFIGPEPGVARPTRFRDVNGALLRQAARFRIFACSRDDNGILQSAREITSEDAQIEWTVHVANSKGAAEGFVIVNHPPPGPRNASVADRSSLIIDPGPRSLTGKNQSSEFDTGTFLSRAVSLGSARTDTEGRLLVIGAKGESGSVTPDGIPVAIANFVNNDTWFDNTCDGVVSACVRLPGQSTVEAKSAWVVCAPPDFAPEIVNFRTLYDVFLEIAVANNQRSVPQTPSFVRHVQPILARAIGYQWVNGGIVNDAPIVRGAFIGHSDGQVGDFTSLWPVLADTAQPSSVRQRILNRLRDPSADPAVDPNPQARMPRLHDETDSNRVLPPTTVQYAILQKWVAGTFVNDLAAPSPDTELLPDALDRVALEACSGGGFYPGIEVNGEVVTEKGNYSEAFRLKADQLTPGQLTARNAVPWQTDFLACRWNDTLHIGWWPAQRPDHVIPESALDDPANFDPIQRVAWERGILTIAQMMTDWHQLGIVAPRTAPDGTPVYVETERTLP